MVGTLPQQVVVGAAISPDGNEIIVKTYSALHYWKRSTSESVEQALSRPAVKLSYQLEIQGEAIAFRNDNSGFFTLSERPALISSVNLDFYKRK